MLPWETDASLRDDELGAAFADVWRAIRKVVFSRTLDSVQGNARLAEASVAEEAAAALDATEKDVSIGGAGLAAAAIQLGLVDELRMFRTPFASRVVYEALRARPPARHGSCFAWKQNPPSDPRAAPGRGTAALEASDRRPRRGNVWLRSCRSRSGTSRRI